MAMPERGAHAALRVGVTLALVVGPLTGVVIAGVLVWGRALSVVDVGLAVFFYVLTGLGITVGFHRGLTHRSFRMRRGLQAVLVVAGSMAFEGAVIDWVATHRRHHAFTDRPGDPHSPYRYGTGAWAQTKGLGYAHLGWLLSNDPTPSERYAPDLLRDNQLRRIDAAFPVLCVASLALPFALGAALTGSWRGGLTAFIWAGLVRVAVLQHVTWSVNSLCHLVGQRPYATRGLDRATNLWPLALVSFGESWHNGHHADPTCARHGRGRYEIDTTAGVVRVLEHVGWVSAVHWPTTEPPPRTRAPEPRDTTSVDSTPRGRGARRAASADAPRRSRQPRPSERRVINAESGSAATPDPIGCATGAHHHSS
ncbi:MAG: fatty acid desaturase [Actinomycetales bacterium]|nr:fatty acid desaturase [Actinomycetales bacterium]